MVQGADALQWLGVAPDGIGGRDVCRIRTGTDSNNVASKTELGVQGRHQSVEQLPQLGSGQLGAAGDKVSIEGEKVVCGDEGAVERWQQVRERASRKAWQHLQQVRHEAAIIGAAVDG